MDEPRNYRDGRAYDRFKEFAEVPLLFAALALIPVLAAPYIVDVSTDVQSGLTFVAWLIWAMFVVEYVTLFALAPNRWHMVRTHLFDLLIIVLPFLRPLRAARSARLLRLLTISGRLGVGFRFVAARKGFRTFLAGVIAVVVVGGLVVYAFERNQPDSNFNSVADALWWAVVTSTTVGYGDYSPVSNEGRAVAVVLMFVGIGLLSVVTAQIAAFLVADDNDNEEADLRAQLDRIEAALVELQASNSK